MELSDGCQILSHVVVDGRTHIGPNCRVYPFASIGSHPQDMKYQGEPSKLVIGANNIFREHVTVNPGTEGGGMITAIGNNCLFMMSSHVAHDCQVGNHVIMANNATLAGPSLSRTMRLSEACPRFTSFVDRASRWWVMSGSKMT